MKISINTLHFLEITQQLSLTLDKDLCFKTSESVGGGCINQISKLTDQEGNHWILKENHPQYLEMFIAEAEGLQEIKSSQSIRVPDVYCYGETQQSAYLLMEYIPLSSGSADAKTGQQLAQMHQYQAEKFGWHRGNYIGTTPQSNKLHSSWIEFWKSQRLLPQLVLAKNKGYPNNAYDDGLKLADNLSTFFTTYQPIASLLHGDLWGGNQAHDESGNPIIFDPAVYYGDRESDIAMTELFGGFSAQFYSAYNDCYPLDKDYSTRKNLYNLYHVLNHYNLFGGSYASQAANMTKSLLAEIG
ncbi:fructosamine kinase family protein [uncultured Cocleimonas sp.]|uniref:fructosamine kinase family protein n=1 Tax=uncultured Cocleimonas sp. TaxID=1051587 RepID=UPI0026050CE8|nr:fructosamine kinase family protein [uncultured Cocleimonas sp.]